VQHAACNWDFHFSTGFFPSHRAASRASYDPCQKRPGKDPRAPGEPMTFFNLAEGTKRGEARGRHRPDGTGTAGSSQDLDDSEPTRSPARTMATRPWADGAATRTNRPPRAQHHRRHPHADNTKPAVPGFDGPRKTALRSIRQFCIQCMGGSFPLVADCPAMRCIFHPYRTGAIEPGACSRSSGSTAMPAPRAGMWPLAWPARCSWT